MDRRTFFKTGIVGGIGAIVLTDSVAIAVPEATLWTPEDFRIEDRVMPMLAEGCLAYQRTHGGLPTGVAVSPDTYAKLAAEMAATERIIPGMRPWDHRAGNQLAFKGFPVTESEAIRDAHAFWF